MKAVFLDRDGTLIKEFAREPWNVKLLPGVEEALNRLQSAGYALFVVSNQADVGRGRLRHDTFAAIHGQFLKLLPSVHFTHCYYCFHTPEEDCPCRKPKTGLLDRAFRTYDIDRSKSWMIGDRPTDELCGCRANLNTVLLGGLALPEAVDLILESAYEG